MVNVASVLFLLFPNFNTLDVNGPIEIFNHNDVLKGLGATYTAAIASATEHTTALENIIMKRHHSFDELLENNATLLASYDILIVPGGMGKDVHAAVPGLAPVVQAFAQLDGNLSEKFHSRWIVSVCTGALVLGELGLFAGKTVTTHFLSLDDLRRTCAAVQGDGPETTVVRKRWVDAGSTPQGARLITSGGISSGIDSVFWLVSQISSYEGARKIAQVMEYHWDYPSGTPSDVTEGYIVPDAMFAM
ncbi:class I glutamine amidotransferase-like protein [Dissoconium aciculare CBS 342.82]|uniref:Class I glutamine amidotransferase-like protein n=1 Tax=Dissoconium aciculare CBS 342.82 TaxID=1314786 RepID=A0A6J3MDN8_9PEZI|nr:class I glutamine amidotransferase-like protein [Dissoconium aciculare CBS 342.82]KAF1824962.1 class I glutamine amidotransferase-like protein [Dissoconium aciculare CBS 342.82]